MDRADVAYSVALTTLSTLLCPIITPALTWLLIGNRLPIPYFGMMLTILQAVLLPLAGGKLFRKIFRRKVQKYLSIFPAISIFAIVIICAVVVARNVDLIISMSFSIFALVLLLNGCGLAGGFFFGRLIRLDKPARRTLTIEIGMQNAGMGTVLALTHFSDQAGVAAAFGCFYRLVHNFSQFFHDVLSGGERMNIERVILMSLTACLLLNNIAFGHYRRLQETGYPAPPPLVEAGENAALLRVNVIDEASIDGASIAGASAEKISATVSVNNGDQEPESDPYAKFSLRRSANRHKGPIRFRKLDYYFFTDGYFQVLVPPGTVSLEIRKGYEYQPKNISLSAAANDTIDLQVKLSRWIFMAGRGWISGDTHIHMDRTGSNDDTLLTLTSAKDIRFSYLLSMNTTGYDRGNKYESWMQAKGLGQTSIASRGNYVISSGQEYRVGELGHVTVIMNDKYLPGVGETDNTNKGPSLGVIADQAHELNGYISLNHGGYADTETDGLLLGDKMDFLELLQFGGYRSLGLEGWYDFLNLGFRLPIVGACDYPYTRELGSELTYVWNPENEPLTARSFASGLAAGRSFVSSGPMLFMEVSGNKPGETIHLKADEDTILNVSIELASELYPVRHIDLIVNGWVSARKVFPQGTSSFNWQHRLRIRQSSWITARAYAEAGTEAHTNPVYVYLGAKLPLNKQSARNVIARLGGSLERITNIDVLNKLQGSGKELENLISGNKHSLPLPNVTGEIY